jgi:hypothetical protein
MSDKNTIEDLLNCRCKDKYSIEPHGGHGEHALYFARCNHRHGFKVLQISECTRQDVLDGIVEALNRASSIEL